MPPLTEEEAPLGRFAPIPVPDDAVSDRRVKAQEYEMLRQAMLVGRSFAFE